MKIPNSHPRYDSLMAREALVEGVKEGLVVRQGLIAHGRGEAFDYLIGEASIEPAVEAEYAAAGRLLRARHPVISVNGNVAALSAKETVEAAKAVGATIEANIFHRTEERVRKIVGRLKNAGAKEVLGLDPDARIEGLDHPRGLCAKNGIYSADVVLVPLEDGDRAQALKGMGKVVLTIDLNPLSRTSRISDITIVDNITRCMPSLARFANELRGDDERIDRILSEFDNKKNLSEVLKHIARRLAKLESVSFD
ncbi:MAG: phosphopantothenate/pantothenate synthetase [Thermoplasmata archaeon]|nr:phosphopantothenate/pantothenate synthetase [Thermoplasmata archaeon]